VPEPLAVERESLPGWTEAAPPDLSRLVNDWLKRELFRRTLSLASAAHELKTPLSVMSGYTDLLLGEHLGSLTSEQRAVLQEMQQNASRLQRFILSFLSFSALESGKFEISKELGDLNECIAEALEHWRPRLEQRQAMWEFVPDRGLGPMYFDPLKVQHIVSNLLDNALKFSQPGMRGSIKTGRYLWERRSLRGLGSTKPDRRNGQRECEYNAVRINVTDNGPGIAPEFHQEIFNEFLRVHGADQPEGMGLGLAQVHGFAHQAGGTIKVESELGKGSTFSVLLPIIREQE